MSNSSNKNINRDILVALIGISLIIFFVLIDEVNQVLPEFSQIRLPKISWPEIIFPPITPISPEIEGIKKFQSEQEFKEYLEQSATQTMYWGLGVFDRGVSISMPEMAPLKLEEGIGSGGEPERVSETTVQVAGIDEPDIVKTDGKEIYFSGQAWSSWEPRIMTELMIWPPPEYKNKTKVIKAFPPTELGIDSKIDETGNLLLSNNILVIFSGQNIYGYDVSDPKAVEKKWEIKLEGDNYLVDSRLYQSKIYLVVNQTINTYHPCPIKPLTTQGKTLEIGCADIYHPIIPIPVDVTFVAMILNPLSGEIENKVPFVGSSGSSVVYMSENAIYMSYSYYENLIKFYFDFFKEKCTDIIPSFVLEKIEKLEKYDISQSAKWVEFELLLENYLASLDNDEQLRINNELANRVDDYCEKHKRDLEKTGIIKISVKDFEIVANANIPGYPLNQFALDEYQTNLRIATTIGERWLGWGIAGEESANDVYVLDENLAIIGSVQDLGLTERIYSVRFVEDKGYVVTFRETDPFYVLDLFDPKNPQLKGELKIPGYSSYLHPITKDKILGIGKEDWQVKISLFDVSSPTNPKELDKYILDESWSDILSTHHAFLLDKKHSIFFLPGSQGAYIFSYQNDQLKLVRAVKEISSRRAIYIDDYLYVIADNKIIVLDELTWEKINELEL